MSNVAAVILAAGAGTRFGRPKASVRLGGATLLQRVVATAGAAGLSPVMAVVPPEVDPPPPAVAVVNDKSADGLSRSLRLGLAAVPAGTGAAVILLVDQPTVRASLLMRLLEERGERPVVASTTGGISAPPVLLERAAFDLAADARGDTGLRSVLQARPDLVRAVEVAHLPRDVDTPADLAALGDVCRGCGALLQPVEGPTHEYIGASPACWAAYGELLAREFGDPTYGRVHRHSVDAYAAQHPGVEGRRQRQSVALHLVALCHWLEHDLEPRLLNRITQRLATEDRPWPWLTPPTTHPFTVLDVLDARSGDEHVRLVRHWAQSVWRAWADHHEVVRSWAAESARQPD